VDHPEDANDDSLDEWIEAKGLRPRTSGSLVGVRPD